MTRFATLSDLPPEILLQIFTPLTLASKPVPVCPCAECNGQKSSRRWVKTASRHWKGVSILKDTSLLSILLIHPIVNAIASNLFYIQNEFVLVVHSSFVKSAIKAQDTGLFGNISALRRVKSLTVEFETMRWFVRDVAAPLIQDMAVNGQLAKLKVKLFEKAARASWLVERGTGVAPSMLALLQAMDAVPGGGVRLFSYRRHGYLSWKTGILNQMVYDVPGTFGEEQMKVVEMDWRIILKDVRKREELEDSPEEAT
ncbi:hypothetical protein NLU13_8214 [Sarocladium strictum]|uniref:Uncharacterized protein n=1 Tax=Sarocladium strictum TaxID=5046 RepID=A0AA39L4Y1_SARSR|nr:hypothetical protein NLU13_8214 [Sarocladium strictum]